MDLGFGADSTAYVTEFVVHTAGASGATDISASPRVTAVVPRQCAGGGDVNGDGYGDFTVVGYGSVPYYTAWLIPGPITADTAVSGVALAFYEEPSADALYDLALHDLDGDGAAEWIVTAPQYDAGYYTSDGRILVFPSDLSGELTEDDAQVVFQGGSADTLGDGLAIADLEGDGLAELVVGGWSSYDAWLFSMDDAP